MIKKILAKALAFEFKKEMSYIVHCDKTGFMEGRFINENNTKNLIEFPEETNQPILLLYKVLLVYLNNQ